jgi:adenylate cyclase
MLRRDVVRLGKIYEAFIYSMALVADEYGFVRNIVGDRVMVVFQPSECFVSAVNCAALMYTVAMKILKPLAEIEDFKVGIGIEHGELLVLRTGIQKRHAEQSEYKGLVWVGDAPILLRNLQTVHLTSMFQTTLYLLTIPTPKESLTLGTNQITYNT